jgi:hypothetical protein
MSQAAKEILPHILCVKNVLEALMERILAPLVGSVEEDKVGGGKKLLLFHEIS